MPVTPSFCANYSAHRQKCICCHYTGVTEDEATEDGDLRRSMHCLRTNDFHRRTAANLELTRLSTVDLKKPQELNKVDNDPAMTRKLEEYEAMTGPLVRSSLEDE